MHPIPSSVALYWDFENLHASLCEARQEGSYSRQDNRFKVQEPLVQVQAVVDLAASLGPLAVHRAYCNWQFFGRYREVLLHNAIALVQRVRCVDALRPDIGMGPYGRER